MPSTVPEQLPTLSVIIPARNEQENIGECLASILPQILPGWDVTVVDDRSDDMTASVVRDLQEEHPSLKLLSISSLPEGWTGKNHAVWNGAREARGEWILFTDADTRHEPGGIGRALQMALDLKVDALSFSPSQRTGSPFELALQPVIFQFLSWKFPYHRVNDPGERVAAANGQFLLIRRDVYERIGTHEAVRSSVLEDVELARKIKGGGLDVHVQRLFFASGAGIVSCRMYRSPLEMWGGWRKNLAMLMDCNLWTGVAYTSLVLFYFLAPLLLFLTGLILCAATVKGDALMLGGAFSLFLGFSAGLLQGRALRKAGYPFHALFLTWPGAILFLLLVMASFFDVRIRGVVTWKGEGYKTKKSY